MWGGGRREVGEEGAAEGATGRALGPQKTCFFFSFSFFSFWPSTSLWGVYSHNMHPSTTIILSLTPIYFFR